MHEPAREIGRDSDLSQVSSDSTLHSIRNEGQALPHILTKASLLEHTLQQHVAFLKTHRSDSSLPSYVSVKAQHRETYKRSRTESAVQHPKYLPTSPSIGVEKEKVVRRTSSLDRGRATIRELVLPGDHSLSLPQHPLEIKEDPFVADRDAHDTASLWREVATMSGRQSFLPKPTNSRSAPSRSSATSQKLKAPSPYDNDFVQRVLQPRSIRISLSLSRKPHAFQR